MLFTLAREGMQEEGGQSACPPVRTSNTASVNGQAAHSQQPWPHPFPHRPLHPGLRAGQVLRGLIGNVSAREAKNGGYRNISTKISRV